MSSRERMYITGDSLRSKARSNKNQMSSKDIFTMRKTTDYERQRELNIERNNKRFQELGIPALGSSLKRVKTNVIENNVADGDDEYVPTNEERMHAKDDESIALKKNSTLKTSFKNPISRQTSSSKPHTQMIFSDEMFEASSNPEMTNLATSMGHITRGKETGVSGVERLNQHRIHAYNLNGGASERQASITRSTTSQNDFVRVHEREETGMFEVESLNQHHTHGSNFDGGAFERQAPPTRSTTSQRDFLRVHERDERCVSEVAGLHEYRTPGDMDGVSFKRQAPITRSRTSQREILPVHERGSSTTNILMNTSVGDENRMNSSVQQATPVLRGKTKCQNWKRKRDIIPNKVEIEIPPELNRVVGMNSTQFISEASYLMKQCMPLDVEDWGHIHPDKKRKYFMKLKELFKLPEGHHVEKTIKRRANTWYRKWRYDLRKKAYSDHPTVAGRLANCPSEVDPEEWKWLVSYWDSEKFRRRSETNKNNQKSQTMLSKVGTKSIASSFYDMLQAKKPDSDECDEENLSETEHVEDEPYYLALWEMSKKRKNGTWSDEYAEQAYDNLKALHQEQLDKYGEDNLTPQEAFEIFLKHKKGSNHQRGMGQGVLSFHSYVKKDITKVLEQERIDTEVNKRVSEINETYEARTFLCIFRCI